MDEKHTPPTEAQQKPDEVMAEAPPRQLPGGGSPQWLTGRGQDKGRGA